VGAHPFFQSSRPLSARAKPSSSVRIELPSPRFTKLKVSFGIVSCILRIFERSEEIMRLLASVLMLFVMGVTAYAADVDGTWAGTVQGPMGDIPVSFTFKADGTKLTGSTTGLDGGQVQIMDGKIDGNTITFTVTFDFGGMPFMLSYKGVVSPDQIMMSGDAFGMPFEFVLKKAK
jgi:hypothetical protein